MSSYTGVRTAEPRSVAPRWKAELRHDTEFDTEVLILWYQKIETSFGALFKMILNDNYPRWLLYNTTALI